VDVYNALGWRRGRLIIENQTLDGIVAELNRYYPGHIFLRAGETGRRKLNAVIDLEHIDDWLAALEGSQPLEVSRFGPIAVIH
jgi:transmembrane sensor